MELKEYQVEIIGGNHRNRSCGSLDLAGGVTYSNPLNYGYVEMRHGQSYKIMMRNNNPTSCNAIVKIDGQSMGTWRIQAYSNVIIERPANIDKKFTFYKVATEEGSAAGLFRGNSTNGLVQVEFIPARERIMRYMNTQNDCFGGVAKCRSLGMTQGIAQCASFGCESGYEEGGTALHGKSDQRFGTAEEIDLDYSKRVTISLRLVSAENVYSSSSKYYDSITPLNSHPTNSHSTNSHSMNTPIPPPIGMYN
jgi:hypothetical protein